MSGDATIPVVPAWVEVGGSASGSGLVGRPSETRNLRIAVSPDGTLYALWSDRHSGAWQVYLKRWDGQAWSGLARSDTAKGLSDSDAESRLGAVGFDRKSHPQVTWMERRSTGSAVYFKRWTGSRWEEIGGSATKSGVSSVGNVWWPELWINVRGHPVIVWEVAALQPKVAIYLKMWNGQRWQGIKASAQGHGLSSGKANASLPQLVGLNSGKIFVIWEEGRSASRLHLARFNGTDWSALGGQSPLSPAGTAATRAKIVLDAKGRPVVVWQASLAKGSAVHLKRWNGSRWVELGGSATNQGISAGTKDAKHPDLILTPAGRLVVAWEGSDSTGRNIYLRGWNGKSWVWLEGAAAEGGVSRSASSSSFPHLAADKRGVIVAWEEERSAGSATLYLRRQVR